MLVEGTPCGYCSYVCDVVSTCWICRVDVETSDERAMRGDGLQVMISLSDMWNPVHCQDVHLNDLSVSVSSRLFSSLYHP